MNGPLPKWKRVALACVAAAIVVGLGSAWWVLHRARQFVSDLENNPVAAARVLISRWPEIEEAGFNEDEGTITLRNTTNGKEVTVGLNAMNEGRLSFSSESGEFTVEDADGVVHITSDKAKLSFSTADRSGTEFPDWVPLHDSFEIEGRHALKHDTGTSGGFNALTGRSIEEVADFYDHNLTILGFEVLPTRFLNAGNPSILLTAEDRTTERMVVVNITTEATKTRVALTFNQGG